MRRIGYARVSSRDQHLDVQRDRLAAVCDEVYLETGSGTTMQRPQLQEILRWLWKGDTLVVVKLDRLARNVSDLYQIASRLQQQGAQLEVLDQPFDLGSLTGKIVFAVLGLVAELETNLRKERQMAGIRAAQARGVHWGRGKKLTPAQVQELCQCKAAGISVPHLAHRYGMTRASIYRYLVEGRTPHAQGDAQAAD